MKRTLAFFGFILWAFTFCISTAYCQDVTQRSTGVTQQQQTAAEPFSIKADKLGETLAEWKANNPAKYCDNSTVDNRPGSAVDPDVIYCSPSGTRTFANQEELSETAWFYKGRLFEVEIILRHWSDRSLVITALGEKFGTPSSHEIKPLQNGFGAHFEAHTWRWTNGISTIELAYEDAPEDYLIVTFALDNIYKEIKDRRQKYKANKARTDM